MTSFFTSGLIRSGLLLSLLSFAAYGQEVSELPLGTLPMQYNGSFAGEKGSPRVSSNFGFGFRGGYRWAGYYRGTFRQQITYDQFVSALSTGIGLGVQTAQYESVKPQNVRGFSVAVAPKISLNGKYTLSPSLSLEYTAVHSPARGVIAIDSLVVPDEYRTNHWLGRAGLLVNTDKFYVGYSVNVLDHWAFKYVNGPRGARRMNRFSSYLQLGYTFQRSAESHFSVTPQVAFYVGQGADWRRNTSNRIGVYWFQGFNLNFRYKQFIWGVNNTGLHAGWQSRRIKLMASNGINLEGGFDWHHFGNLSLRYLFKE